MNGNEATIAIRDIEKISGSHALIVALTANAFKEDRDLCIANGMDDYISKPFKIEQINQIVDEHYVERATLPNRSGIIRKLD